MNSAQGLRGFVTFLILLAIVGTGIVGFNYISIPTNTTSQADEPRINPINVAVINLTESTADITWTTLDPASSSVIYSTNKDSSCLSNIEAPKTDCVITEITDPQTTHTIKLKALTPNTTYFFRTQSNGKIFPVNSNNMFKTNPRINETPEPTPSIRSSEDDFDGFGDVNVSEPNKKVLGVSDDKSVEPEDPLGDIDDMMQKEFKEAMTYNDSRYDFNKDGDVTMADYPLFIEFVMNYNE